MCLWHIKIPVSFMHTLYQNNSTVMLLASAEFTCGKKFAHKTYVGYGHKEVIEKVEWLRESFKQ